jgi:cathepsin C
MKLFGLSFALALAPCQADIPVHCHAQDVMGQWDIEIAPATTERTSCKHMRPDAPGKQPGPTEMLESMKGKKRLNLEVATPARVGTGGKVTQEGGASGEWRMIADEGFEINFAADALGVSALAAPKFEGKAPLKMFAFSRYDIQTPKGANVSMVATMDMASLEAKSVSKCGETILGWYSLGRERWGCWKGTRQVDKSAPPPPAPAVLQSVAAAHKAKGKVKHLSFAQASLHVERINARNGKWNARVYNRWLGKTPAELALHRGVRYQRQKPQHLSFLSMTRMSNRTKFDVELDTYRASLYWVGAADALKKFPKALDWREERGGNYLEPVADQGACGSCWAVSGMRMLTARHKIAQKKPDALPWSISFPLYCSEFNQGCEGGYGILASSWSADVGLLPANCATYSDSGKKCAVNATCVAELKKSGEPRWRATASRYLGGRQDLVTEALLIQELNERGPVMVSLKGPQLGDDFMFYSDGVYTGESKPNPDATGGHAVLLIGYGEEDKTPYWIVQNSWGADWGEDGYVRMSRSITRFGSGEVGDVIIDEQNGSQVDRVVEGAAKIR